jgi:hypothetical protein
MFVDSSGDVGIGTNSPSLPLHVFRDSGVTAAGIFERSGGSVAGRRMLHLKNNGVPLFRLEDTSQPLIWDFRLISGGFAANWTGASGAEMVMENNGDMTIKGSYLTASSRDIKRQIEEIDGKTILLKLDKLGIHEWSYKSRPNVRHIGPMAEEFYATFEFGPDDKYISSANAAGLALAAAKALKEQNDELRAELTNLGNLQEEVNTLREELKTLKASLQ